MVTDNVPFRREAPRLGRAFHLPTTASTLQRWVRKMAAAASMPDILARLEFSGMLSLDEYMPRRAHRYEQIAGDAVTLRVLSMEPVPEWYGRGVTAAFLHRLQTWGLKPHAVVFDMWTTFPKVVRQIWPQALLQYDHFHVQQWIHKVLKNALLQYRRSLRGKGWALHREELWELRWSLLKDMDRWGPKEHVLLPEVLQLYRGTLVEQVLLFKQELWELFDASTTAEEAYAKRDTLARETWWRESGHLSQVMAFLQGPKFEGMVTYLRHPEVPRCGHSETLINVWRQIEGPRRGFKSPEGRLAHLKLYQIHTYLGGKFP